MMMGSKEEVVVSIGVISMHNTIIYGFSLLMIKNKGGSLQKTREFA